MALETKITWNGAREKTQMSIAIQKALIRSTNLVQSRARLKAPIDIGNLRASIVTMVDAMNMSGIVSTNSEYAPYVEFGTGRFAEGGGGRSTPWVYKHPKYGFIMTVGQHAQPYLRPALSESKADIRKIFIQEGSEAIDK